MNVHATVYVSDRRVHIRLRHSGQRTSRVLHVDRWWWRRKGWCFDGRIPFTDITWSVITERPGGKRRPPTAKDAARRRVAMTYLGLDPDSGRPVSITLDGQRVF